MKAQLYICAGFAACILFSQPTALLAQSTQLTVSPSNTTLCLPGSATLMATPPQTFQGMQINLTDDEYSGVVNIGFPFSFFGVPHTQCIISSNNYISFNTQYAGIGSPYVIANPLPSIYDPKNAIMCPWQDIDPGIGGIICYATLGTAPNRVFVVAFCSIPMFWCPNLNFTSQIQLYEGSNRIETHIASKPVCASWNGGQAIHGIQNATGTSAYVVPGRNSNTQWTTFNEGYNFIPSGAASYTQGFIPFHPLILSASTSPVSWYNDTTLIGTGDTLHVSPITTTTYTATITGGCIGMSSALATVHINAMHVHAGPDDSICSGNSTVIHAVVTGTSSPMTYTWSPGTGLSSSTTASPTANPIQTTTYILHVTDSTGCSGSDTVVVRAAPTLTLTGTTQPAGCGSSGGSVFVTAGGGFPPYHYSWSPGTGSTGASAVHLAAGNYTVTISTKGGCSQSGVFTVKQNQPLTTAYGYQSPHCMAADGTAWVHVSGGTSPYTYSWKNHPGQTGDSLHALVPGNYCVLITDGGGCMDSVCIQVLNASGLKASITSSTNPSCPSICDGKVSAGIAGGQSPYTYSWNTLPAQTATSATGLCSGTYRFQVTDANGCSDTIRIQLSAPPALTVSVAKPAAICEGQNLTLLASASGGTPGYTFSWNPQASIGNPIGVSPQISTTYTVTAEDANKCQSAATTVFVAVNPPLELGITAGTDTLCSGQSLTLQAVATGGGQTYVYTWLPGQETGSSLVVNPVTQTTYTAVVNDNCSAHADSALFTVFVAALPAVTYQLSDTAGCPGTCIQFTNTTTASQSLSWNFGDSTAHAFSTPVTHCYTHSGLFPIELSIRNKQGCVNAATQQSWIHIFPVPEASFAANPTATTLLDPKIQFKDSSAQAVSWLWNFGFRDSSSVAQNPVCTYPDTGKYVVTLIVRNSYGCSDTSLREVWVKPDFVVYVPNSFSPNGDGLNDIFIPRGVGIDPARYDLIVFDRWGNQIFESLEPDKGWDGKANKDGASVQIDTYVWTLALKEIGSGRMHYYRGDVSLIK